MAIPSGKPLVSIGMPVYNGERFIAQALDSLLAQTFEDFQLIVLDNASEDSTREICEAYMAADRRVRYIRNERNIGAYKNFNLVFRLSSGEYFKWAAADDVCLPEHLARCLTVLDSDPTVVVAYPKTRFIDESGNPLDLKDPGWDLRFESARDRMRYVIRSAHWVNVTFGLIRASALAKTRLFPAYWSGDYRLLGELSLLGKFCEVPGYFFLRRIHSAASSQNTNVAWREHFLTGKHGRPGLPLWHLCFDQCLTILRSNLAPSQKLSLVGSVFQRMSWRRRELLNELGIATQSLIGKHS